MKNTSLRSNSIKDRFKKKQPTGSLPSNTTLVFFSFCFVFSFVFCPPGLQPSLEQSVLFQPSCGFGSSSRLQDVHTMPSTSACGLPRAVSQDHNHSRGSSACMQAVGKATRSSACPNHPLIPQVLGVTQEFG